MKKTISLVVSLLLAGILVAWLTGCKTNADSLFAGTWGYTDNGHDYTYTFNSDMSFSGTLDGNPAGTGTYTIDTSASTITLIVGGNPSTYNYTFSNHNNTLKLAQSGSSTIVLNRQ